MTAMVRWAHFCFIIVTLLKPEVLIYR